MGLEPTTSPSTFIQREEVPVKLKLIGEEFIFESKSLVYLVPYKRVCLYLFFICPNSGMSWWVKCFFRGKEERRKCLCFVERGKSNLIVLVFLFWPNPLLFLVVYYVFQYFVYLGISFVVVAFFRLGHLACLAQLIAL